MPEIEVRVGFVDFTSHAAREFFAALPADEVHNMIDDALASVCKSSIESENSAPENNGIWCLTDSPHFMGNSTKVSKMSQSYSTLQTVIVFLEHRNAVN